MPDPYVTLGVERTASTEEVKRAHRRKAKQTHPDTGGKREEFEAVQRAVALLLDPERRARYDETGDDKEPDLNGIEARALTTVNQLVVSLVEENDQPERIDILFLVESHLQGAISDTNRKIAAMEKAAAKADRVAKRFVRKHGENVLARTLQNRAPEHRRGVKQGEDHLAMLKAARKLLKGYTFEVDAEPQPTSSMFVRTYARSGTSGGW